MHKIEKLIRELCPEGVPLSKIDDHIEYEQPTKYIVLTTNYADQYETPVLTAGQTFLLGYTDENEGVFEASPEFPVIIFDDFTTAFKWVDFRFKVKSSAMKILRPKEGSDLDLKFLFHWMGVLDFAASEHARHWISVYSQFHIPTPPLKIQQEIVLVLDKFRELEAELEAELNARRSQFNFFVDELTSAEKALQFGGLTVPLGDLGEFVRGSGLQKSDLSDEGAEALHYGQIFTFYKTKIYSAKSMVAPKLAASIRQAKKGDVIVATTSENVEDVCKSVVWLGEGNLAVGGETYIFKHELDPLYATYLFRSRDFQYQKLSHISGTKVKRVSGKALEKITVSVPNREAQVRIGSFLSQLEDLFGDVSEGLPAEIQARRKQYEYYRNKLLTFKELDAA